MSALRRWLFVLVFGSVAAAIEFSSAQETKFDVPAMVEVSPIFNDAILPPDDPYEKLLEVVIPVSCWIDQQYRDSVQEFRFDVYWHRAVFPVVEYGPKTLLQSPVHGFIAVEKRADQTVKLGGDSQIPTGSVTLGAKVETAKTSGRTERFEAIPQHDLLVASGSINRGTGVFFRFHSAKQFSLEGGRELNLVFRVPRSWRGGILRVDCLATGTFKKFLGLSEELRSSASFIVPAYLKGDRDARQTAVEYVQSEQLLRQDWSNYLERYAEPKFWDQVQEKLGTKSPSVAVSPNWALQVIHSPVDTDFGEPAKRLPENLRTTLKLFADARRQMASLSK